MSEPPIESLPSVEAPPTPNAIQPARTEERKPGQRSQGRQKRSGKGRSAYTFPDELERCFCRNATRVPPRSFPVAGRDGAARPRMVELIRTESRVLFCDLLHDGAHMWPEGDEFTPS